MTTKPEERMAEIEELPRGTYYDRLVANVGSLEDAAIVDLAIEGTYWYVDLRRRPFAGNPELKALYRAALEAGQALTSALIHLAWRDPEREEKP